MTSSATQQISTVTQTLWTQLLDQLHLISQQHPDAVFANSLAAEDMVIEHAIRQQQLPITSFMLDTGRLPTQTLELAKRVQTHYQSAITVLHPDADAVAAHVSEHGAYAFYESLALRQACCQLRKVQPLQRYLKGKSAWITGQRREQSQTRTELQAQEYDAQFGLQKFNPLRDWNTDQVWEVIRAFAIPYNPMHDQGYPSIGCDPCTRAIRPSEDLRAGRWWWEQRHSVECGLHASPLSQSSTTQELS